MRQGAVDEADNQTVRHVPSRPQLKRDPLDRPGLSMTDELIELQAWYHAQCNGDWEHSYGVSIGTLDNPGWSVEIDLVDTPLSSRHFNPVRKLDPDLDWFRCEVKDSKWIGHGGPNMLRSILRTFLDWANGENGARAV